MRHIQAAKGPDGGATTDPAEIREALRASQYKSTRSRQPRPSPESPLARRVSWYLRWVDAQVGDPPVIWDPGGTSAAGAGSEAPAETGGMASEPGVSAPLTGAPYSVHGADPRGTDGPRHTEGDGAEVETGSDSESVAAPIAQASGLVGGGLPPGNAGAGGRAAGDAVPSFVGAAPKAKQLPPSATPARGYEFPRFASTDINADLSMEELDGSIKEGPDSAAGPSGVSNELLRWLPPSMRQVLLKLMNYCVRLRCYPSKWLHGYIYLIPKPGKRDADNMRPISLVEDCLKALTRVLNVRLMDQLLASGAISANQYGFLRGRGSTIPYHILLSALEDAALQKVPIRCGTFDIQSAFCSVEAWSLQDAYRGAGISPRSCQLLGALDGTGTAQVLSVAGSLAPTMWNAAFGRASASLH